MRRLLLLLAVAVLAAPSAAVANGSPQTPVDVPATDLADATGAVAPSAALGHVAFSRLDPATGRYELVGWTAAGGLRILPAGERGIPFDADIGPGADGHAVVTWSRCTRDGTEGYVLPSTDFTAARGCVPEVLDLDRPGARPRRLRLAGATGLSLTTPSIRGRSVAAVAAPARGSTNARVLLWTRTSRPPVRLRGGTAPACPYRSCEVAPRSGVDALDLGAHAVAFVWRLTEPPYGAGPGLELRSSSLLAHGPGRQLSFAQGYVSGACGFRQPLSPTSRADGGVAFLLAQSPCDELQTTLAVQRGGADAVLGARPAGVLAYGAAFDGSDLYWLRGAPPQVDPTTQAPAPAPVPCARPGAGCRLVVSHGLPLSDARG